MGLWSDIRSRLRGGGAPAEDAPGWRVLRHLGVDGNFLFWAQREGKDLAGTWADCPRADWLVNLAARAGVDRRSVAEAAVDCAEQMPDVAVHGDVLVAAERFTEGLCEVAELCHPLTLAIDESVDRDPDLRVARMGRHVPVGRRFPRERIDSDLAERNKLRLLAGRVQRHIAFDDVRQAIWGGGPRDAPYR